MSAVLASYVYDTEVFRSDGDQFLVVILFLVCIALGGTALTGMWAVRRENAKVMRMVRCLAAFRVLCCRRSPTGGPGRSGAPCFRGLFQQQK